MMEVTARDVELIRLNEKIDRLQAIIDLYIAPQEDLFSDDDTIRANVQEAIIRRRETDRDRLTSIPDIQADIQDTTVKLDRLMRVRKPGETTQKRLKHTEALLIARNNEPIPFSEMSRLQEFKPKYRDQDMTKLGHVYEQFSEKYEVRASKLGGKTIKLNPAYFKHLTQGRH